MAVPNIFGNFAYDTVPAVADVQAIIDDIKTLLTSTLAVGDRWVDSPSNTLTSPADPVSGYFMQLILARVSATRMTFRVKDQNLQTAIDGEYVLTAGETIKISGGPKHIFVWGTAGAAMVLATMSDPSPEAPNAPTTVVFAKTSHTSSGTPVSFGNLPERWSSFSFGANTNCLGPYFTLNSGSPSLYTAAGSAIYVPAAMVVWTVSSNPLFCGHGHQLMWGDSSIVSQGRVEVPIDDGVVGIFERIGFLGVLGQGFANQCAVLLARVG